MTGIVGQIKSRDGEGLVVGQLFIGKHLLFEYLTHVVVRFRIEVIAQVFGGYGRVAEKQRIDVIPVQTRPVKAIAEVIAAGRFRKTARRARELPVREALQVIVKLGRFEIVDIRNPTFPNRAGVARH